MGLLQVGIGAAAGVLADQWREYFYCDSLSNDVLVKKGVNRKAKRGFNFKGSDNLISNGSIIAVNEGQAMMIVEQGSIVEFCAQAGEFVFDKSTEPTIFYGDLKENILRSFETFKKRFTMGGDTGTDQRVYFFNTKEIIGNKYGTVSPIPFRVVDQNIGLDIEIALRCHGEYAYRLTDPILFYKNISGNVEGEYNTRQIDSQLKSELLTALQPAFAKISDMGIRYYSITGHTQELANILNDVLSEKWGGRYGIEISEFGVSSVKAPEEDEAMIKELQRNAVFRNPNMAAAHIVGAQAAAMQSAAANEGAGSVMAFAGMNMAGNAGGMNAQQLFEMGNAQEKTVKDRPSSPSASTWGCSCGHNDNTGKFCMECGKPKPEADGFWACSCGTKNKGKFCMECGKQKPMGVPQYRCDKCGWEPSDINHLPKFCPECGDGFDDGDIVG